MRKSFLLSLSLHLLGLWLLSLGATAGGHPPGGEAEKQAKGDAPVEVTLGEILPKPEEKKDEIVKPDPEVSQDALIAAAHNSQDCPNFYGGIGVEYDVTHGIDGTYVVDVVVPGYPAARAGIQVGDVVLKAPIYTRGEVGTTVLVPVLRGSEHLQFALTREKICTTKAMKRLLEER